MELHEEIFQTLTRTQDIVVVTILNSESSDIVYDDHFCFIKTPKTIPYHIIFKKVNCDDSSSVATFKEQFTTPNDELQTAMNVAANRMVIFLDGYKTKEKQENDIHIMRLFRWLHKTISDSPIRKTLYSNLVFSVKTNRYPGIYRTYNIIIENEEDSSFGKMKECENELYVIIPSPQNNTLPCQLWFNLFLQTLDKCGHRRLVQLSETCYLNVVLNAFILSKRLRHIVLIYMNAFLTQHPQFKYYITLPLQNVVPCANIYSSQSFVVAQFFYRIMYNLFCRRELTYLDRKKEKEDILKEASCELFQVLRKKRRTRSSKMLGGKSLNTLLKILHACSIPSFADIYDLRNGKFVKNVQIGGKNPNSDTPAVEPLIYILFANKYIRKHIRYYSLEAAFISFSTEEDDHVVVGFFCDGIPKIFDSNGFIFEYDWTNIDPSHFFKNPYFVTYGDTTKLHIKHYIFISALKKIDDIHASCPP